MTRLLTTLALTLTLLAAHASAVTLRVTDRDLQRLLGYGESTGSRITLQLAQGARNGPVVVFVIDEKGLVSYTGTLRDGQIFLDSPPNTALARFLASRGLTLSTVVASDDSKSLTAPTADPVRSTVKGTRETVRDTTRDVKDTVKDTAKDVIRGLPGNR